MNRQLFWTVVATVIAVAAVLAVVFSLVLPGSGMSVHGYIATGVGVVLALVLGVGLMFLVFYSSRRGYDESAGKEHEPDEYASRE